jgi:hypothetical protein
MARTTGSPSHNRFSHFRCEECTITNVNRKTYTVTAESRHTAKTIEDIQVLAPYHHYANGEGAHHLPEPGAICLVGWPSDNTPPFVMGYLGAASVQNTEDDAPERSTVAAEGSATDASFRSRRPQLNPGDLAFTTRDENFIILRRGGVLQLGSTPISQRVYIPVLNFIKDFCENYEMHTFGGDVSWTVGRQEDDPSGDAPATYTFHMNEFAQDAKATVRVQHLPLGNGDKAAWQVHIAPQGIDRDDGSVESEVYSLVITTGGDKTEIVGGARNVTVRGNDTLTVEGSRTVDITGDHVTTADGKIESIASGNNVVAGAVVKHGSRGASIPHVKGTQLVQLLSTATWIVDPSTNTAVLSPAAIAQLQTILSQKVFLE